MCKFSVLFLYSAVMAVNIWSASCISEEDKAAIITAIAPLAQNCGSECGLDNDDFEKYKEDGSDMDPCFKACLMTQMGVLDKEGKYDGKGLHKAMEEADYPGDKDDAQKFLDELDRCFDAKGDNSGSDEEAKMKRADVLFQCMQDMKEK
uniref:Odorant-binding protein 9 n=1 Tax=Helicoverpa assulta TaxID=52344 RepID=L7X1X5_HELAU|nr:odorant-binding protein 9 [Helicoverpa assulta]